ncbi:adenosine deaminase [Yoonia sediminilitoris]|uniref:Adenosine deaminase n=1 Tax=Yoonia sediminilitoris TaxID=1286148 RepID=A0A2T6KQ76_9RHOB|nr:adenosine deaminase [Yoonia sediminilitoris]PUB18708.1 adenosine deaminase [Yoonia sediminilitoris]RCW98876.1 adenosine deaminase [Yoonia sediminilitoris]
MTFKSTPKVELHTHLEGCAPPAFIKGLAAEKKIDISKIFTADGGYAFRNFDHFLQVYEAACTTLQSPDDFRRLVSAVLDETAAHGVVYMETFVSPDFCGGGDLDAWHEYLAAMKEAADEAEAKLGITLRGIVTGIRHFGPDACKPAARCAAETMGEFIVGYGMAGGEMVGRPADYAYSFDMAREAGLPLTCHAGEWGGASMVAETLTHLKVSRIGHGIGAASDPALVEKLAEEEIVLEVCPGSNVNLEAVSGWAAHPIVKLRDAGVPVTVSTDDPPFFHTTMTEEYDMLHKTFGWAEDDFAAINATALKAAFCDDTTREKIAKKLETA